MRPAVIIIGWSVDTASKLWLPIRIPQAPPTRRPFAPARGLFRVSPPLHPTRKPVPMSEFHVYDTTLRDGAQQEGLSLSVQDKLAIARHLDDLGVGFIEGGWPGAIPKDTEFFRRAVDELTLRNAVLAAFGSTRKAHTDAAHDPQVRALLESKAP